MREKRRLTIPAAVLLLISASAGACGGSPGALGDAPTLSGQLMGWTRGPGFTLQASLGFPGASSGGVSATAPIDAMGRFSIILPGRDAVAPYLTQIHADAVMPPSGCSGGIQISPQEFAGGLLGLQAVSGSTRLRITYETSTHAVSYVYFDRDVDQVGEAACSSGSTSYKLINELRYRAGWNQQVAFTDLENGIVRGYVGPVPAGVQWRAVP